MLTDKELLIFISQKEKRIDIFIDWCHQDEPDDVQSFAVPEVASVLFDTLWEIMKIPFEEQEDNLNELAAKLGLMLVCEILPEID